MIICNPIDFVDLYRNNVSNSEQKGIKESNSSSE